MRGVSPFTKVDDFGPVQRVGPALRNHMKYIAAHIEESLMARVSQVADDLKVSRSALVRLALESYLARPHRLVQDDPVPATGRLSMTITD